jgi:methyl-accepting chemotaxis protein
MAGTSYFLYLMASFTTHNVNQMQQAQTESEANFNRISAAVEGMNLQIKKMSESSAKIFSACREISVRNTEHDGSIKELSGTVERFTSSVHSNTLEAAESSRTLGSLNTVIAGKKILAENLSSSMNRISVHSTEISTITGVINDISFQTNLLALNAAIEAARAGDAGRGFMVVSAEVKNLSQKTTESSKKIREIIERNSSDVDSGAQLVLEVAEFFSELIKDMNDIVVAINRISDESSGQMNGVKTMGHAVENLVHTGSVFSSAIIDLTSASDELREITSSLEQVARNLGRA